MRAPEGTLPKVVHMTSEGKVIDKKDIVVPAEIGLFIVQLAERIRLRKEAEAEETKEAK